MKRSFQELRTSLAAELDSRFFSPDISVLVFLFGAMLAYWLSALLVVTRGGWFCILILPMGFLVQFVANANHEILHGNVVKSKRWMYATAIPGMFLNLTSPHFWTHTHLFHHRMVDLWSPHRESRRKEKPRNETPRSPVGAAWFFVDLFFFDSFRYRAKQVQFLVQLGLRRIFQKKEFILIFLEVGAILVFHLGLFLYLSFGQWCLVQLVPFLIFCFTSSCFFLTAHSKALLLPGITGESPPIFTMRTTPVIDRIFFHLGYHVEHHLFPNIPQKNMPVVASLIAEKAIFSGHRYNHLSAIKKSVAFAYEERFSSTFEANKKE